MAKLTSARHDTSPDQEEKNQRSDTLVTLHPNREHLVRLRRCETSWLSTQRNLRCFWHTKVAPVQQSLYPGKISQERVKHQPVQ